MFAVWDLGFLQCLQFGIWGSLVLLTTQIEPHLVHTFTSRKTTSFVGGRVLNNIGRSLNPKP